jgi:hypothetical protein
VELGLLKLVLGPCSDGTFGVKHSLRKLRELFHIQILQQVVELRADYQGIHLGLAAAMIKSAQVAVSLR